MDTEQRVAIYGPYWRLTPAQRRRAAKKDRKAKQRPAAFVTLENIPGGVVAAPLDDRFVNAYR